MSKCLRFIYVMIVGVMLLSVTACGDGDDEPGYSPEEPVVGTWIIEDVSSPSYTSYVGGLLNSEEKWKREFIEGWTGKKLTFKESQIEDDVVWIQKYDPDNFSKSDRAITFEVSHADETSLSGRYTEVIYWSDGTCSCRITARMTMRRK